VSATFTWNGRTLAGEPGQSIGAALHAAGVRTFGRTPRRGRPRGLYCVAGACPGCRVRVDGSPGVLACVRPLNGGERVEDDGPLGRLPDAAAPVGTFAEEHVDVLVVGGGERGLRAAAAAVAGGEQVLLCERDHALGGWLLAEPAGGEWVAQLVAAAAGGALRTATTVIGRYDDGVWGLLSPTGLVALTAARTEVHAGSVECGLIFARNDLPGVLTAAGAQRLLVRDGVAVGTDVVIASAEPFGDAVASLLRSAGARVRVVPAAAVEEAHGDESVEAVTVAGRRLACDALLIANGRRPDDCLAVALS
jgi:sarcosine oxidase subunit alpha